MAVRILLVEDNAEEARDVRDKALALGYAVEATAGDAESGLRLAGELAPDVVVTNVNLPGSMDGLEMARRLRTRHTSLPVLVVTGHIDDRRITGAKAGAVSAVLRKPVRPDDLRAAIELALHNASERSTVEQRHREFVARRAGERRLYRSVQDTEGAGAGPGQGYRTCLEHVESGLAASAASLYRVVDNRLVPVARLTRHAEGNAQIHLEGDAVAAPVEDLALRAFREHKTVAEGEAMAVPLQSGHQWIGVLHVVAQSRQRGIDDWRQDVADYAELIRRLLDDRNLNSDIDTHLADLQSLADLDEDDAAGDQDDYHGS